MDASSPVEGGEPTLPYAAMAAATASDFNSAFVRELHALQDEHGFVASYDVMFLAFLRAAEQFGYFRLGPIVIDVAQVERVVLQSADPAANDYAAFSRLLMREWKQSGRARIDELHFLYAFMRCNEGVPARVFGELAVTPEDVEAWLKRPPAQGSPNDLLTPEEVAEYLKVHVETVRLWIRSGRLPAFRLGGLRALRIRRNDVDRLLLPVESGDSMPARQGGDDDADLPD